MSLGWLSVGIAFITPRKLLLGNTNENMTQSPLNLALIGFGTVGSGVAEILETQHKEIQTRAGRDICVRHVVVRDVTKQRDFVPAGAAISDSIDGILQDESVDLVVQLVGGTAEASDYIRRFLAAGKDVVTANKALLYEYGNELFQLAAENKRTIGFEAAVAGGIPIIAAVTQGMAGNQIQSIEAILNGTSNFILTQMLDHQQSYEEVLREAQRLGYAEADPAMDVDGTDAAQKLSILTQLAFATRVAREQMVQQGIDSVELSDLEAASGLGYKIKLLATTRIQPDGLELAVQPTLIRKDRMVAQTDGANNIVALTGSAVGKTTYSGAGAGRLPTASAVVADIVDYATGRAQLTFASVLRSLQQAPCSVQSTDNLRRRYYLRFTIDDRPRVLADIASILGRHEISISSVRQDEPQSGTDFARLVIMTHDTTEGRMREADADLEALSSIRGDSLRLPVID